MAILTLPTTFYLVDNQICAVPKIGKFSHEKFQIAIRSDGDYLLFDWLGESGRMASEVIRKEGPSVHKAMQVFFQFKQTLDFIFSARFPVSILMLNNSNLAIEHDDEDQVSYVYKFGLKFVFLNAIGIDYENDYGEPPLNAPLSDILKLAAQTPPTPE